MSMKKLWFIVQSTVDQQVHEYNSTKYKYNAETSRQMLVLICVTSKVV